MGFDWRVVSLVTLIGCTWTTAPDSTIPWQQQPFYYYDGQRVYLVVEASRLTIQATGSPAAVVRDALRPSAVGVDSVAPLSQMPDHWIVWLAAGTSDRAADAAAATLRQAPGITFASPAYQLRSGRCSLLLVNRFMVAFKADVGREQIDALNARLGVTQRPERFIAGAWALRYPARSAYTPLEIAAYYARHALVRWADPDMIGCFGPA